MIPDGTKLYTWVDAKSVIAHERDARKLPTWFVSASAYWDGLTIKISPNTSNEAMHWIQRLFDPRVRIRMTESGDSVAELLLESLPHEERTLPVSFEETGTPPELSQGPPSFAEQREISKHLEYKPSNETRRLPILALHSFKGGSGRTTMAIAVALAVARTARVLLVDADFEAPGITWLLGTRLPEPGISLADVLALAQGDDSEKVSNTVALAVDRLKDQRIENIFFLPAFRSRDLVQPFEIRPEHLAMTRPDFFLSTILRAVANEVGAQLVVVDLRAGVSELAAGVMLDPSVYRIFVTTLSGQSLVGTEQLMRYIGSRAGSKSDLDPYPAIIVSQIPRGDIRVPDALTDAWSAFLPENDGSNEPVVISTEFEKSLQILPADWEEVSSSIAKSQSSIALGPILEWLPLRPAERQHGFDWDRMRRDLKKFAGDRIFAERRLPTDFLATGALRALVSDHRASLPIVNIVGAKGAGKTFTFLELAEAGSWAKFCDRVSPNSVGRDATIVPVLFSQSLHDNVRDALVRKAEGQASLRGAWPYPNQTDLVDLLRRNENLTDAELRDLWLDVIAKAIGVFNSDAGGKESIRAIRPDSPGLIGIIDGLEELYVKPGIEANKRALRSLLRDVPAWLSQLPNRALGLIVFVRRDYVEAALEQNTAQFLDRYKPYALNWDKIEALRLVAWSANKSKTLDNCLIDEDQKYNELSETLVPLWGKKLGRDESREARTSEWVLTALSDLRGQIQARDVLRFLEAAADRSLGNRQWTDRVLAPPAIRDSPAACSVEKVKEVGQEDALLKEIFEKIVGIPAEEKKVPFEMPLGGLSQSDINTLQDRGVVAPDLESRKYWVAEIFLSGLNFSYRLGGRHRTIKLTW